MNLRAGKIFFNIDGIRYRAKGAFDYNVGADKNDAIVGQDTVHGYKSAVQIPMIEGAITDGDDLDLKKLLKSTKVTVTLELANSKTIVGREMWYAGEGTVNTEEGEIPIRFECREELEEV